jgi:hypothetical protein
VCWLQAVATDYRLQTPIGGARTRATLTLGSRGIRIIPDSSTKVSSYSDEELSGKDSDSARQYVYIRGTNSAIRCVL